MAAIPAPADDDAYEAKARAELDAWLRATARAPTPLDLAARELQTRIWAITPEQLHTAVTEVVEALTRAVLAGADMTTPKPLAAIALGEREARVRRAIDVYRTAGAVEGGVAGAGGFFLTMAEFPALLATKIKLLFDIAAAYGHDGRDLPERLYILQIFQLAFSGGEHRRELLTAMTDWEARAERRPTSLDGLDWRRFQQEYRDYIDLAKMAQLIPVIGAPVGAVVNWRLLDKLGETAINAYRMRWFARS